MRTITLDAPCADCPDCQSRAASAPVAVALGDAIAAITSIAVGREHDRELNDALWEVEKKLRIVRSTLTRG